MSIDFNATTSKLENGGASGFDVDQWTIAVKCYADGLGEGDNGVISSMAEGGASPRLLYDSANTLRIRYAFSGSQAVWTCSLPTGQWNDLIISYDRTSVSNVPVVRLNGSNISVTTVTAPIGTPTSPSAGYCIGNITGQTGTWDGKLQDYQFYNRILSDSEKDQIRATPGSVSSGLVLWLKMRDGTDRFDYSASPQNGTATDLATGPPAPMIAVADSVAITGNAATFSKKRVISTGAVDFTTATNYQPDAGWTTAWDSPTDALSSNDVSSTVMSVDPFSKSQLLTVQNATALQSIPEGSTIHGVTVEIERGSLHADRVKDHSVYLTLTGTTLDSDNLDDFDVWWPTTDGYKAYGGGLWGLSSADLLAAMRSGTFGVMVAVMTATSTNLARVDHIRATVFYSSPLETGSVAISGNAANLLYNRVLQAATGNILITGNDANLLKGYKLEASVGSIAITGNDVNFVRLYSVNAELGTVSISGVPTNLLHNKVLNAELGTVTISGNDANLLASRYLDCDAGSVDIVANDAALSRTYVLQAEIGTVLITGNPADLFVTTPGGYTLPASPGSVSITGNDTNLLHNRVLVAETGTVSIVGNDANLIEDEILRADSGTVVISGIDITLLKTSLLQAELGTLSITGNAVQFLRDYRILCETGVVGITGNSITFRYDRVFRCETGSVVITCNPADLYTLNDLQTETSWKSKQRLNTWSSVSILNTWTSKQRKNTWN